MGALGKLSESKNKISASGTTAGGRNFLVAGCRMLELYKQHFTANLLRHKTNMYTK